MNWRERGRGPVRPEVPVTRARFVLSVPVSRLAALAVLAALGGCAHQPLDYIPPTDRSLLEAQSRLGADRQAAAGGISVDRLLAQARAADADVGSDGRLVLTFPPEAASPDDAQRARLRAFAASLGGAPVEIAATRREPGADPAMLPQRRAVAVAHVLGETVKDVTIGFSTTIPPDRIVVQRAAAPAAPPAAEAAP